MALIESNAQGATDEQLAFTTAPTTFLSTPGRNRAPWSADEIDRLCAMMSVGRPIREIARQFGRTQEAVRTKAYQLDRLRGPTL